MEKKSSMPVFGKAATKTANKPKPTAVKKPVVMKLKPKPKAAVVPKEIESKTEVEETTKVKAEEIKVEPEETLEEREEEVEMSAKEAKKEAKKKAPKKSFFKKSNKDMTIYSSLAYKHKMRKEAAARKRAEELAELPKNPIKRFFARLHPKRVFRFIFSFRGLFFFLKCIAVCFLLAVIGIGALFLYYKKDLEAIRLDEMKVSETVNTYLDRNGVVLWEDKGDGDYRLVVDGEDISKYMRWATVAIEDRNFYNHPGVDFFALVRATLSTLGGGGVQGGSTLTQQLIKQVYFSDEAASEDRGGISRKIKEMILAIELEKMYSKEQIITMYLNESPYGGRRNGVESAAQAYFGKSAKDLTLAESALLAAVPNNPAVLNPYNEYGHDALIARQQKTLDVMVEMGYITKEDAEQAKAVDILATIKPEASQYKNIRAPHFVLEVKQQLEEKYGMKTMRAGGFTIKTTIDIRAQEMAEKAVATGAKYTRVNRSDNIALASVDVETAQVIAMVGSIDWNKPVYGEVNATTSLLEPGSTIKPILDYGPLFMQREGRNYGPGSILKDENIDKIYCNGNTSGCKLRNYSGKFSGNISIRKSLANSLNIPAVKALYINGIENSLNIAHKLGDWSYCADADGYGLAIAIGSGCRVRAIEHANAYASVARGGVYKPLTYVLEVKNSSGDIIEQWEDTEGERVYDAQTAYMLADILGDANARRMVFGSQATSFGFKVNGVWTGSKTGTTTTANSAVTKDSWMASFSTSIATVVWNGNHDGSGLSSSTNEVVRRVVSAYMEPVHKDLYAKEGKWKSGDKPVKPAGIKTMKVNGVSDIWPSWYNSKTSGSKAEKMTFNKVNKKLATECTLGALKVSFEVNVITDPVSGSKIYSGLPDGYNEKENDDCSYVIPNVVITGYNKNTSTVNFTAARGSANLNKYIIYVDETQASVDTVYDGGNYATVTATSGQTIRIQISDVNGVTHSSEITVE
jgi:penicillin-binding protein 1A